jgi:hypothetical protein
MNPGLVRKRRCRNQTNLRTVEPIEPRWRMSKMPQLRQEISHGVNSLISSACVQGMRIRSQAERQQGELGPCITDEEFFYFIFSFPHCHHPFLTLIRAKVRALYSQPAA